MNDSSLNIVTPGCSIPPNGNAGARTCWNCWNGYVTPKYRCSDASAEPTCAWIESVSTSDAREPRTQNGVFVCPATADFHGPAANANKYVRSGSVSRKRNVVND